MMAFAVLEGSSCERSIWAMERQHGNLFWIHTLQRLSDNEWKKHFWMGKSTFEYLAEQLRASLTKQTINWSTPICHQRRLAVVLWWLATPCEYRTVANIFGIGISTLCGLVREKSQVINGTEVPVVIIGDPAYPLRRWPMKGFPRNTESNDETIFNHRLSSAHMVVENAFGRLNGRWRRLSKWCNIDISLVSDVVIACCVLHNENFTFLFGTNNARRKSNNKGYNSRQETKLT
ncbi:hypothetical protein EOD39_10413 [Acipenser ruthenus]|uniref:DDE Tnp4 domain-containing protein n=1 Tax=Acipenser ruthenus TaxID=7906 RepID=A0A444TXU6_ACIRT|nr:hypothetical protein EOD39_10413 [Acipenser ruthenus]